MTGELFATPDTSTNGSSGTAEAPGGSASDLRGSELSTTDIAKEQEEGAREGVEGAKHLATVGPAAPDRVLTWATQRREP